MHRRNVQSNKVVVVVLKLGTRRDAEAHATDDVLEIVHRAGDRVSATDHRPGSRQSDIDRGDGDLGHRQLGPPCLQSRLDLGPNLVEDLAQNRPLRGCGLAQQ